jgi:hypothetical protein
VLSASSFKWFFLSISFLSFTGVSAQKWEVGAILGGSNYAGDLARKVVIKKTGLSIGLLGRYNFSDYMSVRQSLSYIKISADDKNFSEYVTRNLSFTSDIFELGNMVELNFRRFGTEVSGYSGIQSKRSTFFAFSGINVFYFNPSAYIGGSLTKLQPLGTEGQNLGQTKKYKRVGISIPMGGGYKINLSNNFVCSVELGFRKTFTDYLDDVSQEYPDLAAVQAQSGVTAALLSDRSNENSPFIQHSSMKDMRGTSNTKDWYLVAGVSFTYRFIQNRCLVF